MKKLQLLGAVISLFFWFFSFAAAGEITGVGHNPGQEENGVEKSAVTQWQQAFPDAVSGNSSFSGAKNMDENFQFHKQSQETLLGRWVCRTKNGNVTLSFISENQLDFNGDTAYYSSTSDKITVQAEGDTITYPYYFNVKGLVITFPEGSKALFVRDTGPAASASGNIFQQLVGEWKDIRSSGNTVITLAGNGQYSYYSDFAAGNSTAGATNWGTASSNSDRGTWRAQGTPRAGTIYYKSQDGSSDTLSYQVHAENGRTYWGEYYFDGTIYVKQ